MPRAAFLLFFLKVCLGYGIFQTYIPNGDRVMNPFCSCRGNINRSNRYETWNRVGHMYPNGEYNNALNPFGRDFDANGRVWNSTLCRKDSDGDGLTNGYELGDRFCQWEAFNRWTDRYLTAVISHPGIYGY